MGQELRIDTMNWAKIHKSAYESKGGGHLPILGQAGPTHGSAEPPVAPMDAGFWWTAGIDPQWRLEGITDLSNRHNRHTQAIKGSHSLHFFTHFKQELSHILSSLV